MVRKGLLVFCAMVLTLLFHIEASTAGDTSPQGLKLLDFRATPSAGTAPVVGDEVKVTFRLKNVSGQIIKFNPNYGVFVGCRWNSTTDENNRDFGYEYKGAVIEPNTEFNLQAHRRLDAAGTWRFWPAYNINGRWGPFRWNEIVLQVGNAPGGSQSGTGSGTQPPPPSKPPSKAK